MPRVSPIHYIAPSSISVTPNANQSANDLAVYVARGAKIKVYSPRAGINMVDNTYQEWTLTGRNRRLAESEKPYTIYARLQKNDKSKGYLVFAPKNGNAQDGWTDKYNYVTTEGWTKIAGASPAGNNYYIRLGEVSLPENNERTVDLDTGILDTDDFNNNWAASPDALPLRVELGCTINDEDAGPTPYVYWGQSLVLTASLVEGWTGTDIERFDHWEITRDTQDTDADNSWNHPTGAGSYRGMTNGSITLSHARGANDDFNGSVSAVFTVTAMERIEDENNPGNPTYEPLVSETINIHAETLEKYELVLSSRIVSFNPTSETYNPAGGVAVRVRATDQSGYVSELTNGRIASSGIKVKYAVDGTSNWVELTFEGVSTDVAVATISTDVFAAQKNVNVRILSAGNEELDSDSISYLRDGEDSKEREWIFLRSINPITFVDTPGPYQKPALISLGEVNPPNRAANSDDDNKNQDGWVPNGWWDEQQGADEDHPYEYGAYRDFVRSASGNAGEGESTGGQWGSFTDPKIWSHYGGDAVTYDIVPSVSIINADAAGHVSSDGIIIQAFRIKGSERSGNILPPTTGSAYYVEYSIDGGTWTQCAMFSYQPEGEVAVQRYGIAPLSVKQAQTDIALRLKNSANPNEVLKENPPIKVVNIVSEEETQTIVEEVGDARYFRKDQADTNPHLATFGDVHVQAGLPKGSGAVSSGSLEVDNDATIHGDTSIGGDATIEGETVVEDTLHVEKVAVYGENANGGDIVAQSSIYQAQVSGWAIDKNGNMEVSSLKVRNYLETEELRINRLQAQEGDTIFTDNDQIEEVEQVIDETDGSVSYILTFKDKWEGYFTAQRYGNILRGVINTLAEAYFAKQQGRQPIVDKDSPDYDDLPSDSGGNKFFTSWMKIIADRNTAQGRLGLNQVQVVLYADDQTLIPQDKNFPPCVGMVVAHWGCFDYSVPVLPDDTPEEKAQKEELIADIKKRQVFFYLSASEGRIMKLSQVDKPLLEEHNFGMTFGKTPDFIKQWPNYQSLIADHPSLADKDYLFAQGILCHDFIPVTPNTDKPLSTVVFCGDWEDGTNMSGKYFEPAYDQLVDLPCPMHGIYYHGAYNEYTGRYETHTVRHNSGTWMCLENQPVVSGGVSTYYPPKFGSPYWKLIDGNENYSIEFVSSNGQAFYRGHVDTVVTPNLFIGNVDITADISVSNWWWERSLEHPTAESEQRDETWNANHKRMRILHLTNEDMPMEWGLDNKVSFTCKVTINDGKTTRTVNNQVIV